MEKDHAVEAICQGNNLIREKLNATATYTNKLISSLEIIHILSNKAFGSFECFQMTIVMFLHDVIIDTLPYGVFNHSFIPFHSPLTNNFISSLCDMVD